MIPNSDHIRYWNAKRFRAFYRSAGMICMLTQQCVSNGIGAGSERRART